jgi:hypothetical protein
MMPAREKANCLFPGGRQTDLTIPGTLGLTIDEDSIDE